MTKEEIIKDIYEMNLQNNTEKIDFDKAFLFGITTAYEEMESRDLFILSGVNESLVADIRNKLSPAKNLCSMIKDRDVEPFIGDDERNQMIDDEIEQTLISINYLSDIDSLTNQLIKTK